MAGPPSVVSPPNAPQAGRPFGVVLLTLLWLIYAGLAVLIVLDVPGVPLMGVLRIFATLGLLEPAAGVLAGVSLVTAIGIWLLRPWAWVLAMLTAGTGLAFDIVGWANGNPAYVALLVGVAIAFYLNQGAVRRLFLIGAGEPAPAVTLSDEERHER
jgi:hypothetical protein